MTKQEFLDKLCERLKGLPRDEVSERVDFYAEMIDDRKEEGLSEEDAVLAVGSVNEIAAQIRDELFQNKTEKKKIKNGRKIKAWEIVLLAVGSPIWITLLISAFAVVLSLYAVVCSVIISLWAVFGALVGSAVGGIIGSIILMIFGNALSGIFLLGASVACAGLSIFMFFGCKQTTKGVLWLSKLPVTVLIKRRRTEA